MENNKALAREARAGDRVSRIFGSITNDFFE